MLSGITMSYPTSGKMAFHIQEHHVGEDYAHSEFSNIFVLQLKIGRPNWNDPALLVPLVIEQLQVDAILYKVNS